MVTLGDPAYPALPWLMKPYPVNPHISSEQRLFNYRQGRARMVVENAFGQLKGWWRCLLKRLDVQVNNAATIVGACVILHNICEMFGDHCLEAWEHAENINIEDDTTVTHGRQNSSCSAVVIRNAIAEYLNNRNEL